MNRISLAIVVLLLAANASAEDCLAKTQAYEGKSYSYETCVARVDDVVKTNVDGFLMINYIVQYKAQRLVVSDPLARTDHALGDQISFTVGKLEGPADSVPQYRTLFAVVDTPRPAGKPSPS